jgi:PKD repeat protein
MSIFGMNQELGLTNTEGPESEIIGWNGISYATGGIGNAATASNGITALEMMTKLAQTNLDFFYANKSNQVLIYDSVAANKNASVKLQFDSRGGATSYKTINLTDGFDLLKNKITFNNFDTTIPTYTNAFSVQEWGPQSATVDTYIYGVTTQTTATNDLKTAIFQETANPTREVDTITFDGKFAPDAIEAIDILDNVQVYHEVGDFVIDRKYGIIGISHALTRDSWEITYKLRNMFTYETVFPTPTISVSPASGTIDNTFTFTITNLNEIEHANATYSWKDNNSPFSTLQSPTKTYTSAGVGSHPITCTVTDDYGFSKTSSIYTLNVYGSAPSSVSFTHTANSSNTSLIEFVATANNATSYTWNFGDGKTGSGKNVGHIYATSGSKTVTLTATNAYGSTTSSQTFTVTVPPIPANEVGTWPVRYLKIGMDQWNTSGAYWPLMRNFTAKTSGDLTDRAASNYIEWALPYQTVGENWGNHVWKDKDGNSAGIDPSSACSSTLLRNNNTGLKPVNTITGNANWSLVIGLGSIYYDIKTIAMGIVGTAASGAPTTMNIYVTDYVGAGIADGSVSPNDVTWTKFGTINRTTGAFTPISSASMPLSVEPNMTFNYTVGDSAPYKYNQYTFTTNDWQTNSYLWNFGDGTTSTEQNPVHVYTSNGSKTVTLTKYGKDGGTYTTQQTFTVSRQYIPINSSPVRYVKFVQNLHTGVDKYNTPYICKFRPMYLGTVLDTEGEMVSGTTVETYDSNFIKGTGTPWGPTYFDPNTGALADRQRLVGDSGMRIEALDASFRTNWSTVVDYGTALTYIEKFQLGVANYPITGYSSSAPTGISYSIYITDFVDNNINPSTVTWTPAGTITPTSIPTNSSTVYYSS